MICPSCGMFRSNEMRSNPSRNAGTTRAAFRKIFDIPISCSHVFRVKLLGISVGFFFCGVQRGGGSVGVDSEGLLFCVDVGLGVGVGVVDDGNVVVVAV